jgi:hypothetical protein
MIKNIGFFIFAFLSSNSCETRLLCDTFFEFMPTPLFDATVAKSTVMWSSTKIWIFSALNFRQKILDIEEHGTLVACACRITAWNKSKKRRRRFIAIVGISPTAPG